MADFPTATPAFRPLENLPHVTYDAAQKKTIYAEDMTKLQQELLAVMSFAQQLRTELDTEKAKQEYKVGDIFLSFNATNPATVKGYGTWALVAKGQTLVGVDTAQTEFNTVRKTGGAKTHTLTVAEIPAHSHTSIDRIMIWDAGKGGLSGVASGTQYAQSSGWGGSVVNNTGGGGAHNNLQPYLTCYIWERTA